MTIGNIKLFESELILQASIESKPTVNKYDNFCVNKPSAIQYRHQYVWRNIISLIILHIIAIYGFVLIPFTKSATVLFTYFLMVFGSLGVQTGAHRLWAHRSYEANWPLRLFLSLCHVMALQNDLYEWCRDHRTHHKWSDTDADPHNSSRGFFFAHCGWLMVRKHPDVKRMGRTIDLSDLERDPIVMFQRRFYIPLVFIFWGFIPSWIPVHFWNETIINSIVACVFLRYVVSLNFTWLVNSWAHLYGNRPYDRHIGPVEASCRNFLMGEGFHNYHHTFPWDYSASELGPWDVFNPATIAINIFHHLGWAWNLKKVNPRLIQTKIECTGDINVQYKPGQFVIEYIRGLFVFLLPLTVIFGIKFLFPPN